MSSTRGKINLAENVNLNLIYADLIQDVYERGYEKNRRYASISHLTAAEFSRVLEEIGLAAWHGDGRTTTVREIEEHCRASGVGRLLDVFQEGAKAGITRLLAAFFFRQFGSRIAGAPTFVFTHKSFGEYLTGRRILRAIDKIVRELDRRATDPDEGWEAKEALKHWVAICGPTAISEYLLRFISNEISLLPLPDVSRWQKEFARLFSYALRHGMPMEETPVTPFKQAMFQSRNAEESLLAVLNTCARRTGELSRIETPNKMAFGAWLKRVQGQFGGSESDLTRRCLSHLDLSVAILHLGELFSADLEASDLSHLDAAYTNFLDANLQFASLQDANLQHADLQDANLQGANLEGANLEGADLKRALLPLAFRKPRPK